VSHFEVEVLPNEFDYTIERRLPGNYYDTPQTTSTTGARNNDKNNNRNHNRKCSSTATTTTATLKK
jgi:hypothetical protein